MKFEIYKDNKGAWRWRGLTDIDEVFAESGCCADRRDCLKELNLFKSAQPSDIKIYAGKDGLYRWACQKENGDIIADSVDGFYDKKICEAVAETIFRKVPEAEVVDPDSL